MPGLPGMPAAPTIIYHNNKKIYDYGGKPFQDLN